MELMEYLASFLKNSVNEVPVAEVSYAESASCRDYCRIWAGQLRSSFVKYFSFKPISDEYDLQYVPMISDRREYTAYEEFVLDTRRLARGARLRLLERAG